MARKKKAEPIIPITLAEIREQPITETIEKTTTN